MDLNLLVALDALLEENSVAAAADRLHLSAPAMSRTLARIRRATGDDILVRSGRTMTPTPRAVELRDEAHELVRRATALLTPARRLDLAALDRVFTIRGHDALVGAVAPVLVAAIAAHAPRAGVRFLPETTGESPDLARGHVDLELGSTEPQRPEIASVTVGRDRMVVAFGPGHPLADGELTAARFAAAEHVTVSRRGRLRGIVDERLAELGLHRRVVAALPTSAAALDLVARSPVVVVVPERLCRPGARELLTRPVPVELPAVPIVLSWHHRYDSDPAHAWLRGEVGGALRADGGSWWSRAAAGQDAPMTMHGNLLGPEPTLLPVDPAAAELDGGVEPAEVAAAHPTSSLAWAVLAEQALTDGMTITGYAYARTGYHRGLDQLRRNGWKGFGPVPFAHVPNQGFLRALAALQRAAAAIGETEEADRCATFLADSDPAAPGALGVS